MLCIRMAVLHLLELESFNGLCIRFGFSYLLDLALQRAEESSSPKNLFKQCLHVLCKSVAH
jgi:hypothetical protein